MVEKIDNILPDLANKKIIATLVNLNWLIGFDNPKNIRERTSFYLSEGKKDLGFYKLTYCNFKNIEEKDSVSQILNAYADMIFYIINEKLNNKLKQPLRYGWNYYNQSSEGTWHTDQGLDKYLSIVYSLNNSDGGTEVKINNQSKFYKSIQGNAVLFPSNFLHRGTGPKKYRSRFNLNIVCEV